MKKAKRRQPARPIFQFCFDESVTGAIDKLAKAFPFKDVRGGQISDQDQQGYMAERLIVLSLAHIDVTAPRLLATIKYCEAEGLDQYAYLKALTEAKFKKKLHLVRRR